MEETIKEGCDVVGGLPWYEYTDEEARQHIDICFGMAMKHDLDIHMLVDDTDDPNSRSLEYLALKTMRELKDGSYWMPEILSSYGESLVLAGRADEAKSSFEEALSRARELKNDGLVAQTLDYQGDALFYQGDFKAARSLYEQSLQAANRSKDAQKILLAKIGIAEVEVREKNGRQAIPELRKLIQQADDLSLKYSSVECSIFMGEAMMQSHDNSHAAQELQRALLLADKFGQQPLSARAHYLLATIARESGNNTDAQDNYRSVISTLDAMKKDAGAEKLLQRPDLKLMYEDSTRGLQSGKS